MSLTWALAMASGVLLLLTFVLPFAQQLVTFLKPKSEHATPLLRPWSWLTGTSTISSPASFLASSPFFFYGSHRGLLSPDPGSGVGNALHQMHPLLMISFHLYPKESLSSFPWPVTLSLLLFLMSLIAWRMVHLMVSLWKQKAFLFSAALTPSS